MENNSKAPAEQDASNNQKPENKNILWAAVALAVVGLLVAIFGLVQANNANKSVDSQKTAAQTTQQINAEKIDALEERLSKKVSGATAKEDKVISKFEKKEKKKIKVFSAEARALQSQIDSLKSFLAQEKSFSLKLQNSLNKAKTDSATRDQNLQSQIDALKKEVKKLQKAANS